MTEEHASIGLYDLSQLGMGWHANDPGRGWTLNIAPRTWIRVGDVGSLGSPPDLEEEAAALAKLSEIALELRDKVLAARRDQLAGQEPDPGQPYTAEHDGATITAATSIEIVCIQAGPLWLHLAIQERPVGGGRVDAYRIRRAGDRWEPAGDPLSYSSPSAAERAARDAVLAQSPVGDKHQHPAGVSDWH